MSEQPAPYAPLAPTERLRLTACPRCALPVDDPSGLHYVADECVAALRAQLHDNRVFIEGLVAGSDALRAALTQARSTLVLVRSQVGTLEQTLTFAKEQP
jgi:hypothetical protein